MTRDEILRLAHQDRDMTPEEEELFYKEIDKINAEADAINKQTLENLDTAENIIQYIGLAVMVFCLFAIIGIMM